MTSARLGKSRGLKRVKMLHTHDPTINGETMVRKIGRCARLSGMGLSGSRGVLQTS